ncbi:MAG: type II toxin-antitoxin system prevent-host-death family antitoxin [Opitutus sp.]|nr:type II toxin-antitoxin system prevent-host-death family antitoxin [Opitutus sp.]
MKTSTLTVGTFEAKNRFSELIDRVSRGGEVTITRHDKPVARLVTAVPKSAARQSAVDDWLAMRKSYRLNGLSVRKLIEEGRP